MTKLKISTQLMAFTALLLAFFLITNALGLRAFSSAIDTAESVYSDNLLPIRHLNALSNAYTIDAVDAATKTLLGLERWEQAQQTLVAAKARIGASLAAFEATAELPEEIADLQQLRPLKQVGDAVVEKLMALLRDEDSGGLASFVSTKLFNDLAPLQAHLLAMTDRQEAIAQAAHDRLAREFRNTVIMLGSVLLAAFLIGITFSIWLTRSISRQLGAEPHELKRVADAVGRGELYHVIAVRKNDRDSVLTTLASMRDMLRNVVSGVRGNAEAVAIASAEISEGNNDLSARTEQQAAALEQTAASMEELGSTVHHNAANAVQATELAGTAAQVAGQGGDVVNQMIVTMQSMNDSSKRMAGIISTIDSIAFQTNILALNAAVEAARVGEHGRGFAVVAGEVRSLAQRASQAAKEISMLITDSVERVGHGTTLVGQAGNTMQEIVASTQHVMTLMNEISVANKEQSVGVSQVGEAVTQMDQATQQNAALVEESAAAAQGLRDQANELLAAVSTFKLGEAQHAPSALIASAHPSARRSSPREQLPAPQPHLTFRAARAVVTKTRPSMLESPASGAAPQATLATPTLSGPPATAAASPQAAAPSAAAPPERPRRDADDWSTF